MLLVSLPDYPALGSGRDVATSVKHLDPILMFLPQILLEDRHCKSNTRRSRIQILLRRRRTVSGRPRVYLFCNLRLN